MRAESWNFTQRPLEATFEPRIMKASVALLALAFGFAVGAPTSTIRTVSKWDARWVSAMPHTVISISKRRDGSLIMPRSRAARLTFSVA